MATNIHTKQGQDATQKHRDGAPVSTELRCQQTVNSRVKTAIQPPLRPPHQELHLLSHEGDGVLPRNVENHV